MLNIVRRIGVIGLTVVLLIGVLPSLASASIQNSTATVSPTALTPGTDTDLSVRVQNLSGPSMVWVQIVRPNSDYIVTSATLNGWNADVRGDSVVFTGGLLDGDGSMTAHLTVHAVAWQSTAANWTIRVSDKASGIGATDCAGEHATAIGVYLSPESEGTGVSGVTVDSALTSAIIRWHSDVATGSGVSYGPTGDYSYSSSYNTGLTIQHQVQINGLSPQTGYHFQVAGLDADGGVYFSGDNTFVTPVAPVVGGSNPGNGGAKPSPVQVVGSGLTPRGTIVINKTPTETVPPTVAVTTSLARPFTKVPAITGTAGDNVAVARVDYSLDGGKNWVVVQGVVGLGTKRVTFEFAPTRLESGNYLLVVRATDTSGNAASTVPANLVIDLEPPRIGSAVVSFGSQVAALDAIGRLRSAVGTDQTITLNAVGGPVTIAIAATRVGAKRAGQNFYLWQDADSGLWAGVMSFNNPGTYHLAALAVDGVGNSTSRALSDVVVTAAAKVVEARSGRPIGDATVTLYYRQAGSNDWLEWDAAAYGQTNPLPTGTDGTFALLVPEGTYYLKVEAPGYQTVVTVQFSVSQPTSLVSTLKLSARPRLNLGSWSWALPGATLSRTSLNLGDDTTGTLAAGSGLVGRSLPNFKLPTTSGTTATPVSLQGKPTLVTVLATWSPSAAEQLPALAKLYTRADINIVPLYLGEHVGKVQADLARGSEGLSAIIDAHALLGDQLGVPNLPTHYFIDRAGKVVATYTGVLSEAELAARLKGL